MESQDSKSIEQIQDTPAENMNETKPPDNKPSGKLSFFRTHKLPFILGLALVAVAAYSIIITIDRFSLASDLSMTEETLASTQAELSLTEQTLTSTEETLASIQAELSVTEQTLTLTQAELNSTEETLATTEAELSTTKQTLTLIELELSRTQDNLTSTQEELSVAEETLGGLGITLYDSYECWDAYLIDNPSATNPTWNQLVTFIYQDQTDRHTYIANVYDCSQFSQDLHNNAEAAGIRAAVVQVRFNNEWVGHALCAFITTDYGLVYVDCTEKDIIAFIKVGKELRAVDLATINPANIRNETWWNSLSTYYYMPSSTGGHCITASIKIYW